MRASGIQVANSQRLKPRIQPMQVNVVARVDQYAENPTQTAPQMQGCSDNSMNSEVGL